MSSSAQGTLMLGVSRPALADSDLVQAGLFPTQALRAATATTARRFGLDDRGRIADGLRADLLLVDGDPTTSISDTLNTRAVWRRGTRLAA
ncbi:amidohydrolase family protein [Nocardia salmonicida]|uniref:amidohydrolase family protein n=1 Tax=Nocardia salmonicida TaxID=53431 RepID=UPI0033E21332